MFKIPSFLPPTSLTHPDCSQTSLTSSSSSSYKSFGHPLPLPVLHRHSQRTVHQSRASSEGGAMGEPEPAKPERGQAHPSGQRLLEVGCSDEQQLLMCICVPPRSLWLLRSSLQGAYTSYGGFNPYSSLNVQHTPESRFTLGTRVKSPAPPRQAEKHFSQKWVRLVRARHPKV